MKAKTLAIAITTAMTSPMIWAEVTPADLPSMIVSADFRPNDAHDTPVSLTTIDKDTIDSRGAQHIEDVLNLAPNVNFSSGASRGQYFQIRGIGERSQFAAPLNPSVGLVIDGIDFSRNGGAATLFDIEKVEVLRGPQGTRYGTNGLAGTINLQSKQATDELDMHFESSIAEYNTRSVGVAVGGPLIKDTLLGRIALHNYQSDGYMDNEFLGRDNTQNRDEITARGHLKWLVSNDLTVDLNLLHLNIDNGYDAFTLDNSRNSLSDEPGQDKQHTNAFALKTDWRASDALQLQSTVTYSKSDLVYSYDVDWSNVARNSLIVDSFNGFEEFNRSRENHSIELRALSNEQGRIFNDSTDWTVGVYYLSQDEKLDLDSPYTPLKNEYQTTNSSLYGQLDTHLTNKLTLVSGLRVEYFKADYKDSDGLNLDPEEPLFGGKLGLEYQANKSHFLYTTLSRGYKSGGVNNGNGVDAQFREFDTEYLWNLEVGAKSFWLDGALISNVALFYGIRKDAQVKNSEQAGFSFIDYQTNAARGTNAGVEADIDWLIAEDWRVLASLGLLHTEFNEFDARDGLDITGRKQAHAPSYQFNLGAEYYLAPGWTLRANMEGKDEFYYSNSHNEKSGSYVLYNASLEYTQKEWTVTFWGRNLFDKDYYTRGFFFENDPAISYAKQKYTQYGDPRVVGLTLSYDY